MVGAELELSAFKVNFLGKKAISLSLVSWSFEPKNSACRQPHQTG